MVAISTPLSLTPSAPHKAADHRLRCAPSAHPRSGRAAQRCSASGKAGASHPACSLRKQPQAGRKAKPMLQSIPLPWGSLGKRAQSLFLIATVATTATFAGVGAAFSSNGNGNGVPEGPKNIYGNDLEICSTNPMTGFFREGKCETGPTDFGTHTVCAKVTQEFLQYTLQRGNDLMTPRPEYSFPGLKPGDGWCLCASRWREAMLAGAAPPVVLEATHMKTLQYVDKEALERHAASGPASEF